MCAAFQGAQHPIRNLTRLVSTPEGERCPSALTPSLTAVPGCHGWWYAVPAVRRSGGVWNGCGVQKSRALPWCPEVIARAAEVDAVGICVRHYYVVRVDRQVGLLCDGDLSEGRSWEQFTTVDLWQTLALKKLLARIVRDQAQRLPRVVFPEVTE